MTTPTIREILRDYLNQHQFDGLFNPDLACACITTDLLPCDEPSPHCHAGYKIPCPPDCGEHDFHIAPTKPNKKGD